MSRDNHLQVELGKNEIEKSKSLKSIEVDTFHQIGECGQ